MRVAEYVAQWLAENTSGRGYGVCGGGRMWLDDAICHHPGLRFTAMHHEQAAAFAAEADARVSGQISTVHVTAGPGVTNAMTGVACAYADSIPMLVLAGQVDSRTLKSPFARQLGISEVDGQTLMRPITKHSVTISSPQSIRKELDLALFYATKGRKAPVFVEIPLDIQGAELTEEPRTIPLDWAFEVKADIPPEFDRLLAASKRPVILIGNGVRLSGAEIECGQLGDLSIPLLFSWSGADLFDSSHPNNIGRPGIIGGRAANFAIQNADLIIAVGTRLSIPQIGHDTSKFAPNAKLVMVDVDQNELEKTTLRVDMPIRSEAKPFLQYLLDTTPPADDWWWSWLELCREWKRRHRPKHVHGPDGTNVYAMLEYLARDIIDKKAIIVTDVGQSFVCTMQGMPMTGRQRMFHSPGIAPMGYGLPAAIGACIAGGGRQVICITGDGGTMFNLQELQTIVHHKLPIQIIYLNNGGYRTMQVTQGNHFKRESVSSDKSGVSFPDFKRVAEAFGLPASQLFHVNVDPAMEIAPLVKTRLEDGKLIPGSLEDMYPHLPREELLANNGV